MFEGSVAIWLNILTIAILTFVLANGAVSAVVSILAQRFLTLQVASRKSALWLLVTLPWIASLCVTICFAYKYYFSSPFNNTFSFAHWHHIAEFSWTSWHGITLLIAIAYLMYVLFKKSSQLHQHRKQLDILTALSQPLSSVAASGLYEIEASYASAFTSGFITKRCFITSHLLANTSLQEQTIIIKHEQAHANNNDPLKKWVFSILAMFFVPTLGARLKLHMTLAMEQDADNAVISDNLEPTLVASTLVKVARLNATQSPFSHSELVANFGADVLEQRVYFLLGQLNLKPANKWFTVFFIITTLMICIASIDSLHHFIETIFKH